MSMIVAADRIKRFLMIPFNPNLSMILWLSIWHTTLRAAENLQSVLIWFYLSLISLHFTFSFELYSHFCDTFLLQLELIFLCPIFELNILNQKFHWVPKLLSGNLLPREINLKVSCFQFGLSNLTKNLSASDCFFHLQ